MDKYTVIKNGLILTLDRKSQTGYFNIIIKNNKIFLIDYENKFNEKEFKVKNPDAEIIDAKNKLITPGFFNSRLISSYGLNKLFLKKCTYENLNSWHSLKLIERFLLNIENTEVLRDVLKISYQRAIRNGEIFLNESSHTIKKDFFDVFFTDSDWVKQYYNLTFYDYTILDDLTGQDSFLSMGFKADEDINNYSLSSIKKSLSGHKLRLFIDASLSQKTFGSTKKVFGKSFIAILSEMDLLSGGTIISNPTNLSIQEIEIIKQKKCSVMISISDYINLHDKKINLDELLSAGLKIIVGTGYTGNDILSELRTLSLLIQKNTLTYEEILRTAILNPSVIFGVSNVTGSVERNKSADLIFFDLDDIRNTINLPEISTENICEFIIQNLTSKDISDVIIKGEVLLRNRKELFRYIENPELKTKELSDKIFSAGKYFEYKEKYLMRGRVDKLGLDRDFEEPEEVRKEEIFIDMTETGEYTGEGEFTIVGLREEEFEKPRQQDKKYEKVNSSNLKEIKSLENELNLFDENDDDQQLIKPKIPEKETLTGNESITKETEFTKIEFNPGEDIQDTEDIEISDAEVKKELSEKTEVQKTKLKFGFKEDE